MIYTPKTKKAMIIAYNAHNGQVDKSGIPYIYHPIHLAEQMNTETECIVALLHDVVEDTNVTFDELEKEFSPEIIEALKIACAWEFVERLPETIHTAIGERGRGLSEGQAQRLAIARAVLRDAPLLLLDEATSALDVTTERKVLRNIVQQRPNKTCIVTTHRPSVLSLCQRVYRVVDTRVTELSEEESAKMAMDF